MWKDFIMFSLHVYKFKWFCSNHVDLHRSVAIKAVMHRHAAMTRPKGPSVGPSERLPGCRRGPRRHSAGPRLFPKAHIHVLEYLDLTKYIFVVVWKISLT